MFEVTLKSLRAAGACHSGYNKVVRALQNKLCTADDNLKESYIRFAHKEPISLISIFESNGLDDALWALRCVSNHDRDMRLYAVWCARQVEQNEICTHTLLVAERFANDDATIEELSAAGCAARDAAGCAARDAAWDAARGAAGCAARDAAWDAARVAAWDAARGAARDAAWVAAWDAARDAARDAAWDAAWDAQKEMFIKMCNGTAPWQVK